MLDMTDIVHFFDVRRFACVLNIVNHYGILQEATRNTERHIQIAVRFQTHHYLSRLVDLDFSDATLAKLAQTKVLWQLKQQQLFY